MSQLLQYWRQVMDQERRPAEIGATGAKAQAKPEAAHAEAAAAEETGWDRQARALEQVGAQDTRAQRWSSFNATPSASTTAHVHGTAHRAIPEAPLGRGPRREHGAGARSSQTSARTSEARPTAKLGVRAVSVYRPEGAFGPARGSRTIV